MSHFQPRTVPLVAAALLILTVAFAPAAQAKPMKVAIVVSNGVELLDFAGPGEVFKTTSLADKSKAFDVYTVGVSKKPIMSQRFVEVVPQFDISDSPQPDIIVIPGGGAIGLRKNPQFMTWFSDAAKNAKIVMSVCTGAFVLADAGLLNGEEATTHHSALQLLAKNYPKIDVRPGTRFIDNGKVVTTAGISAGIDGALHVVARLHGLLVAEHTAQYMEYHWSPDIRYAAGYSVQDPTAGGGN
jgi:transcriptional regulator GlxA family with amidase domain